jgi:inner membrane protein
MTFVENKIVFVSVAFLASLLPDIDFKFSKIGKHKIFRLLQLFTEHRGIFHSFIFLILITGILFLFLPSVALAFSLGYGLHLFADVFTIEGLKIFHPFGRKIKGIIKTGGKVEFLIFIGFIFLDILVLSFKILDIL